MDTYLTYLTYHSSETGSQPWALYRKVNGAKLENADFILANNQGKQQYFSVVKNSTPPGIDLLKFSDQDLPTHESASYINDLNQLIEQIKAGHARKVVVSRKKFVPLPEITIQRLATATASVIDKKFTYRFYFPESKTFWLGASPEKLLSFELGTFHTHSLAGTAKTSNNLTPKELEEQRMVTDYILAQLPENQVTISETEVLQLKSLVHYRNKLSWPGVKKDIDKYLKKLHPTPAVCGIPVDQAKSLISNFEKGDSRAFYTGYLGPVNKDAAHFFVNLRCAQLFANGILLFAGGGITAESIADREFEETELKMEAILADLDINL